MPIELDDEESSLSWLCHAMPIRTLLSELGQRQSKLTPNLSQTQFQSLLTPTITKHQQADERLSRTPTINGIMWTTPAYAVFAGIVLYVLAHTESSPVAWSEDMMMTIVNKFKTLAPNIQEMLNDNGYRNGWQDGIVLSLDEHKLWKICQSWMLTFWSGRQNMQLFRKRYKTLTIALIDTVLHVLVRSPTVMSISPSKLQIQTPFPPADPADPAGLSFFSLLTLRLWDKGVCTLGEENDVFNEESRGKMETTIVPGIRDFLTATTHVLKLHQLGHWEKCMAWAKLIDQLCGIVDGDLALQVHFHLRLPAAGNDRIKEQGLLNVATCYGVSDYFVRQGCKNLNDLGVSVKTERLKEHHRDQVTTALLEMV